MLPSFRRLNRLGHLVPRPVQRLAKSVANKAQTAKGVVAEELEATRLFGELRVRMALSEIGLLRSHANLNAMQGIWLKLVNMPARRPRRKERHKK
jgi:hypothetical protein